jgi:hypothetical protein
MAGGAAAERADTVGHDSGVAAQHQNVVDVDAQFVRGDLREGGLLALAVGAVPVSTVTLPDGSIFTVALSQPPAGVAGDGPKPQISP